MHLYKKRRNEIGTVILIQDYPPRQALTNEFHTAYFTCKLHKLELSECIADYEAEEDMQFLLFHVSIINDTLETLTFYSDDFLLSVDKQEGYIQELTTYENQFPEIFSIESFKNKTGFFLFMIPIKTKSICFLHHEYDGEVLVKSYRLRYTLL